MEAGPGFIDQQPDPSSLIESMRDVGYSMETAVADLVDNSITANALRIDIRFSWNDGNPWLAVIDDGDGMSPDELSGAMRLGSQNPLELREREDMGRFGLGMKTASFSQCRILTVVSRASGEVSGREWDLDLIKEDPERRWKLRVLDAEEIETALEQSVSGDSGTVILWRKMDRLDNYDEDTVAERKLNELMEVTRKHLELVFHRFLVGEPGRKKLTMTVNGHPLSPFDPYNLNNKATQHLPLETVEFQGETIRVQPYILPHHSKTTKDEYERYEGEGGYLRNQGFYVYRNRRLIIHGTWFRLARQLELTKLARVQIDIPNSLDHLWSIDVKKSRATPPAAIRDRLRQIIGRIGGSGERVYRARGQRLTGTVSEPIWERQATGGTIHYSINRDHTLLETIRNSLDDTLRKSMDGLISAIEGRFPVDAFFNDVAREPEHVHQVNMEPDVFRQLALLFIDSLRQDGKSNGEIAEKMLSADPFTSDPDSAKKILSEQGLML